MYFFKLNDSFEAQLKAGKPLAELHSEEILCMVIKPHLGREEESA